MTATNKIKATVPSLQKDKEKIFYKDRIQAGLSVKTEYLTDQDQAIRAFLKLKLKYPNNKVRLLTPSPIYRKNKYSVRIWV
jgi:hypothetical protein